MDVKTQKKLNYLDETKQMIRAAIEQKGQTIADNDTFRSYAEKIQAIVGGSDDVLLQNKTITQNGIYTADEGYDGLGSVTVDVAGSGGGSLPTGVYLAKSYVRPYNTYVTRRFVLNGTLYATSSGSSGTGYLNYIYKWDGSAWSVLLNSSSTSAGINGVKIDAVSYQSVEFNGKIHFFENKKHAAFDGTTFTLYTDLPSYTDGHSFCVYQNKMVAYLYNTGSIYEWNESTDTWSVMAKIANNTYTYYYLFAKDDILYANNSKTVYRYANGTLENYGTLLCNGSNGHEYKGWFYRYDKQVNQTKLYKYDPVINTDIELGEIPPFTSIMFTYGGDELSFVGCTASPSASISNPRYPCFAIHEVG